MRHLLLVSFLAFLGACPSAPRPILTDLPQRPSSYRYVAASSDQAKTIEAFLAREAIVARFAHQGRVAYVVRDGAATKPLFDKVPFRALDKATLVVHVARVSDINGWGTEVNGEVHRDTTLRLDFSRAELARAFALLQRLETDPVAAVSAAWPNSLAQVDSSRAASIFERGYVIDVRAELVTGNPFDKETRVPLYRTAKRTGYTTL
jgi:hypothetical protein